MKLTGTEAGLLKLGASGIWDQIFGAGGGGALPCALWDVSNSLALYPWGVSDTSSVVITGSVSRHGQMFWGGHLPPQLEPS